MKLKWLAVLGVGLLAAQVGCGEKQALKTEKDKVSYGIGVDVARNLKRQGIDIDVDLLVKGLKDVSSGQPLLMAEKDLRKTLGEYQAELRRKQAQAKRLAVVENKKEGDAFLAENKKKEGVVTLPSGLQYKIIKAGEGKKPTEADTVECHYRGTLINGTEFDGTYGAGEPATFRLTGVVPGWREALKLMPVGSKWQLFIPPELAYGERGAGATIGPNATLIYEVELLAIK
jgi:FKBP-type peptidyl-prolyl cis-trans isomerase FklB